MKREVDKLAPKTGRVARTTVVVVALSILMVFGLLYALTPPTVVTVEHRYTTDQQ